MSSADPGSRIAEYGYGPSGRRLWKKVYTGDGLDDVQHFYYHGWSVIETRNGSDQVTSQDIWDSFVGQYIDSNAQTARNANPGVDDDPGTGGTQDLVDDRYHLLQDHQFSVRALIDADTGDLLERYEYAPYGEQTVMDASYSTKSGGTDYGQYKGFTGQTFDPESGLVDFRSRPWHTGLGWVQRDKSGYEDGLNLYGGYVGLYAAVDPLGHSIDIEVHDTLQITDPRDIGERNEDGEYPQARRSLFTLITVSGTSISGLGESGRDFKVTTSSDRVVGTSGFFMVYNLETSIDENGCCDPELDFNFIPYLFVFDEAGPNDPYKTEPDEEGNSHFMSGRRRGPGQPALPNNGFPNSVLEHESWHTDGLGRGRFTWRVHNEEHDVMQTFTSPGFRGYSGAAEHQRVAVRLAYNRLSRNINPETGERVEDMTEELCQSLSEKILEHYYIGHDARMWILSQGAWHVGSAADQVFRSSGPRDWEETWDGMQGGGLR